MVSQTKSMIRTANLRKDDSSQSSKVTVVTADNNAETTTSPYVSIKQAKFTGYTRVIFQVKSEWPTCLQAQPLKAQAQGWTMVVTHDGETRSGQIKKTSNATVYIDTTR
jgi:hypothetical protein